MKLTILGSSAAYAGPSDACSGYLVEEGDAKILLDCGTGVISNLQHHIDLRQITHVAISHMHADHFIDLVPLYHALRHLSGMANRDNPHLLLPPGGRAVLRGLSEIIDAFDPERTFSIEEYGPGHHSIGSLEMEFTPTEHYIRSYAIGVQGNGRKLTYSGDTRPCSGLIQAAKGADLLLCEATVVEHSDSQGRKGHMMAQEAGESAQSAGVGRLVITHFWPDCDRESARTQAGATFSGAVDIANSGSTFTF